MCSRLYRIMRRHLRRELPKSERLNTQLLEAPEYDKQQSKLRYRSVDQDHITLQTDVGFPGIAAGIDDWAFQGVDMMFFDSLMRGTSGMETAGLEL